MKKNHYRTGTLFRAYGCFLDSWFTSNLNSQIPGWRSNVNLSRRETAASKLDSWHDHNYGARYLSKVGVWTGCGQRQCTPSRQQVACNEIEEPLIPLSFPARSLSFQPADRQSQRCMQLLSVALTLDGGLDWSGLGAATPVAPQGLNGSTPWRTCYKVARSKQGIIASSSLTCSNTATAKLTTGSNTSPTDSTNLRLTMQHKSGTA